MYLLVVALNGSSTYFLVLVCEVNVSNMYLLYLFCHLIMDPNNVNEVALVSRFLVSSVEVVKINFVLN